MIASVRLLVCGSRDWTSREIILHAIVETPGVALVIHGGARGADTLAGESAAVLGIPVRVFPANWNKHGKAAGPIRNQQMLAEGKPTLWLAFTDDLSQSRGTADMVRRLRAAGLPGRVLP